jgi:phosphate transport system protein
VSRWAYRARLRDLREALLAMSDLVCEALQRALDALEERDEGLARRVIEGDDEINERYLAIERRCTELIARQQPVAGEMRFVVATFKISTDLERIGDLATNLATYATQGERHVYPEVDAGTIGRHALAMVREAVAAYATEDVEACYAVADRDAEIDRLCTAANGVVVRDLLAERGPDESAESLLADVSRLFLTIRDLERVGDHAVNVAARTLYMVEGDDDLLA